MVLGIMKGSKYLLNVAYLTIQYQLIADNTHSSYYILAFSLTNR